jgi:oligopeptide transport system ATP-binding protein
VEEGQVFFKGEDLLSLSKEQMRQIRGKDISMIFQDPMTSLNPVLTIERQMTEAARQHLGMSRSEARKQALDMLNLVGIPNAENRLRNYPHEFSGGQRQRIMIAMALVTRPALLIADEPTTALDVTIQAQILDLVDRLKEKLGMAMIWITHDLGVVAEMADRVAVMYAGFIVEMTNVNDLFEHTSHPYTLGLLESLPEIKLEAHQRLVPIQGSPPDLLVKPTYCPFAPRCRFAVEKCWEENPPIEEVAKGHHVACWQWEEVRHGATL